MKTREVLRALMSLHKDTSYSLGEKSGVPQSTISRFLAGTHGEPRSSTLKKIANVYQINESQLRGDVPIDSFDNDMINNANKSCVIYQYKDVGGAMGTGIMLKDQPGQITQLMVTDEWMHKNVPANTGEQNLYVVTGFGDSMRGMFNSGDPLLIDAGIKTVEYDGVYFFRVGEEGFIKRLQRIPGDGIRVISKNTDYESWTISKDMDFEVFGRVLKVWQSEKF